MIRSPLASHNSMADERLGGNLFVLMQGGAAEPLLGCRLLRRNKVNVRHGEVGCAAGAGAGSMLNFVSSMGTFCWHWST